MNMKLGRLLCYLLPWRALRLQRQILDEQESLLHSQNQVIEALLWALNHREVISPTAQWTIYEGHLMCLTQDQNGGAARRIN